MIWCLFSYPTKKPASDAEAAWEMTVAASDKFDKIAELTATNVSVMVLRAGGFFFAFVTLFLASWRKK